MPFEPRVKLLPPNQGSAGSSRKTQEKILLGSDSLLPAPGINLRDLQVFAIHFDNWRGMTNVDIAKKWRVSTAVVANTLKKDIDPQAIPLNMMRDFLSGLNLKMGLIADEILRSVSDDDLKKASLAQKMISVGILNDKMVAGDKHLHGTMDPSGMSLNVTVEDRQALDERLKRLLERRGVSMERVEIEEAEIQEAEIVDDQPDLFEDIDKEAPPPREKPGVREETMREHGVVPRGDSGHPSG